MSLNPTGSFDVPSPLPIPTLAAVSRAPMMTSSTASAPSPTTTLVPSLSLEQAPASIATSTLFSASLDVAPVVSSNVPSNTSTSTQG